MKKILPILLVFLIIIGIFVGCSKSNDNNTTTEVAQSTVENPTDDAVIKGSSAIELIKSYSNEELGITDEEREKCTFIVSSSGIKVDGNLYIEVQAAQKIIHKNEETGAETYTFDTKGEYYISYDGKTILKLTDGKYEELPMRDSK